jgi:hypothetical protein
MACPFSVNKRVARLVARVLAYLGLGYGLFRHRHGQSKMAAAFFPAPGFWRYSAVRIDPTEGWLID